jgi:hypothetical protein
MAETISHTIDRRLLGPAGIDGYLHIVEERRDDRRTAEQRFADRTSRVFHVRAALTKHVPKVKMYARVSNRPKAHLS